MDALDLHLHACRRGAALAFLGVAMVIGITAPFAQTAQSTGLNLGGQLATPEEIAAWNINVFPDGTGYPPGQGSVMAGETLYQTHCLACHGDNLQGGGPGLGPALAGGQGSLASAKPLKTVGSYWPYASTLFDYIRRAMPFQAPQSLTNDEVYSLTAYILHVNEILPKDAVVDAEILKTVQMPNAHGFYVDDRPDMHAVRCMHDCPEGK